MHFVNTLGAVERPKGGGLEFVGMISYGESEKFAVVLTYHNKKVCVA